MKTQILDSNFKNKKKNIKDENGKNLGLNSYYLRIIIRLKRRLIKRKWISF